MIVTIKSLDDFGRGITREDGKTVFVNGALPNEEVDIKITKSKKNFDEAETRSVIRKSNYRREEVCPYYGECGGCSLMHMTYDYQLDFKKNKVERILKKFANIDVNVDIEPSNELGYRNKITLHSDGSNIGLVKKNSNDIVVIDKCLIVDDLINNEIKSLDKTKDTIIRTNGKEIIKDVNNYLVMNINNLKFRIDINSFFQVNSFITSKVFDYINDNISYFNVGLDLYSGTGTLGILSSFKGNKVYSIEVNEYSVNNAKYNASINNVNNIVFINKKVEDAIKDINEKVDLIITDPPRSGMDKVTIDVIESMKPKEIIYMSCDPTTLARDLNILKDNYKISKIKCFDMFPNTYHCESVTVLERR